MRKVKILFVDDENERRKLFAKRWPDAEIFTCETSENAISIVNEEYDEPFNYVYLDHDLGTIEREPSEDMYEKSSTFPISTRPFVRWACRESAKLQARLFKNTFFVIHSWNTEAAEWIQKMLTDYGYNVRIERFNYKADDAG